MRQLIDFVRSSARGVILKRRRRTSTEERWLEPLGLIAGNGRFPFLVARAARRSGRRVVAVAIREEAAPELAEEVDEVTGSRSASWASASTRCAAPASPRR